MKVVLDTNVLVSGIFFSGTPARLLAAWREEAFTLAASPAILDEYRRVLDELSGRVGGEAARTILDLITLNAELNEGPAISAPLCRDREDEKFLACAAAAGAILVSGDKDLLVLSGVTAIEIITPRELLTRLGR